MGPVPVIGSIVRLALRLGLETVGRGGGGGGGGGGGVSKLISFIIIIIIEWQDCLLVGSINILI